MPQSCMKAWTAFSFTIPAFTIIVYTYSVHARHLGDAEIKFVWAGNGMVAP